MMRFEIFAAVLLTGFTFAEVTLAQTGPRPSEAHCEEVRQSAKSADELSDRALLILAASYEYGECVAQDPAKAPALYLRYAENNDIHTIGGQVGYFYYHGLGVKRDHDEARYWFRSQALTAPDGNAMVSLDTNEMAFSGDPAPEMFIEEIKRAEAEYNDPPEVLLKNYRDLMSGNGVHKDLMSAKKWLMRAVLMEDPEALYEHAIYSLRYGERLNTYRIHMSIAAEKNYPPAQVKYGQLYLEGKEAIHWPYMALVWFLRAKINGLDVDHLIEAAESQLDDLNRRLARDKARDFEFRKLR